MEAPAEKHRSDTSISEKLALAAAVCALVGAGLGLMAAGLIFSGGSVDDRSKAFQSVVDLGFLLSLFLAYVVTPLLGWLVVLTVRGDWQAIIAPDGQLPDEHALHLLARRLLTTAVLVGLMCGLPAVGAIATGRSLQVAFPGGLSVPLVLASLAASYIGYVAQKLYARLPGRALARICGLSVVPVGAIVLVSCLPIGGYVHFLWDRASYEDRTPVYDGNSVSLPRTAIVPTLNCPCPPNQNVVWCSSFQLAWNELRDNVIGEPVKVVGAEALAERLNAGEQSIAGLEGDSVYAAAGRIEDGIVGTIKGEMSRRFPSVKLPDFSDYSGSPRAIVAYSYLTAQVPFEHPYRLVERAFRFVDSNGVQTDVKAFGLWKAHLRQYQKVREQMDILFAHTSDPNGDLWAPDEYAIDLCKHSEPYQVVVARVDLRGSLAETMEYVRKRALEFKQLEYYDEMRQFQKSDVLKVPEMFWEIDHRFRELIGKIVANADPSMPVVEAMQTIRFRLDRYGAMVESQSLAEIASIPRHFEFDQPFLVYMQKRGAEHPFFVMWVDNAELLTCR